MALYFFWKTFKGEIMTLAPVTNGRPLVSIRKVRASVLTGGKEIQVIGKPAPWAENPAELSTNQRIVIRATRMIAALVKRVVPEGEDRLEAMKLAKQATKGIKERDNPEYMEEVLNAAVEALRGLGYNVPKDVIKSLTTIYIGSGSEKTTRKATAKAEEE